MLVTLIESVYNFLWGDLLTLPLGGVTLNLSLMVILLFTAGIYFTLRTRLLPMRLFRDMLDAVCEKKQGKQGGLSSLQTLVVSTATRVGMGNLVGVVAAVSVGGAGAVFWMWVTALLGASTSFVESTLAQKYKEPDPLYGGWRGGPAFYLHKLAETQAGETAQKICCGIVVCGVRTHLLVRHQPGYQQLGERGVFQCVFHSAAGDDPCAYRAGGSHRPAERCNGQEPGCDCPHHGGLLFPHDALCCFHQSAAAARRAYPHFLEAFGLRQAAAGGFGAVVMNGVKRGLFSNEAGSGSAPCAAAAAECDDPVKMGLVQALGVLIDTIVICSCTAFVMLLAPESVTAGLQGMNLLQAAMQYHLGGFGVVFIAVTLALFSFSTFIGILFYARCNVAYLFGDLGAQTAYKLLALAMMLVACGSLYGRMGFGRCGHRPDDPFSI